MKMKMKKMKKMKKTEHETEDHHENKNEHENESEHDFPERKKRMTTCAVLGRLATSLSILQMSSEFQANNSSNHIDYFIRKATKGDNK